jgi:hypothetical protein
MFSEGSRATFIWIRPTLYFSWSGTRRSITGFGPGARARKILAG